MGRTQQNLPLKRKLPDSITPSTLSDPERVLYNLIRSKEDMGIWTRDMKRDTKLPDNVVTKSLKSLQAKNLVKEVVNIQNKGKKYYMAVEFEPSKEISGGTWYVKGNLDTEFIEVLKQQCRKYIEKMKVGTIQGVSDSIQRSGLCRVECSTQQIAEILQALILDNEIEEVRSSEIGDFASIPLGTVCYRCCSRKVGSGGMSKVGAFSSFPCGVCPRINDCTPDGIISPITCIYFTKWFDALDF